MFNLATNFKNNNVSSLAWDTSSVVDMNSMFQGASLMDLSINSWNVRQVTDMAQHVCASDTPSRATSPFGILQFLMRIPLECSPMLSIGP